MPFGFLILHFLGATTLFLLAALLTVISIKEINKYEAEGGERSDARIVMDEVAGTFVALSMTATMSNLWLQAALVFVFSDPTPATTSPARDPHGPRRRPPRRRGRPPPGAAWLQRQVHDLFGVSFDGGDNRPLIHHVGGAPLRKDVLLEERQVRPWPGALEPGHSAPGARKLVPPGVPDPRGRR